MEPTFHPLRESDINTFLAMQREFYAIDEYPFDEGIARTTVEALLRDATLGRIWLMRDGDVAIGYVVLVLGYSLEFHGRDAFMDELFVVPAYRHRGVGTRAIQHVVLASHELGVHALHLEVERHNVAAQALYRKLGFKDHDRYLMTRWTE